MTPPMVTALRTAANAVVRTSAFMLLVVVMASKVGAESTNSPGTTNGPANDSPPPRAGAAPQKLDEAAFSIIAERNIFNAERIGTVRIGSSRRPISIETFKLVGTMAYEKGAFAFFEGSKSELTKVVKADGLIAGYKLVDILADAVKLEANGKIVDLLIGTAMRREDNGAWHPGEAVASSGSSSYASSRENGDSSRSSRFGRNDRNDRDNDSGRSRRNDSDSERSNGESNRSATSSPISSAEQAEILKKMMERRERESQ